MKRSGGNPPPPPRRFPAPTNLKVLPKSLTGQQGHDIMEQWEASLGTHCNSCHAEDPRTHLALLTSSVRGGCGEPDGF
jgi:hypothetical protein